MVMLHGEQLDRIFHALADPTRRHILEHLSTGEQPVSELVDRFDISQPAVSKHLAVLARAGLITRHQSGRQRLSRARREALRGPLQWIRRYTRLWNDRLDALEVLLDDPIIRQELEEQ